MSQLVTASGGWALIYLMLTAIPSVFLLSRLIKLQHDEFKYAWLEDGRPILMPFWWPPNLKSHLGFRNHPWYVGNKWLIITPSWAKESPRALRLLRWFRLVSWSGLTAGLFACLAFVVV